MNSKEGNGSEESREKEDEKFEKTKMWNNLILITIRRLIDR